MSKTSENQRWFIYGKKADFNQLAKDHGITPVTARIMINRGVQPEEFDEFLYGTTEVTGAHNSCDSNDRRNPHDSCGPNNLHNPYNPHDILDIDLAADILEEAISSGQKIRIVGDYDIDGVCATTILIKAIRRLGGKVDYDIPDRVRDGYGINERIIDQAIADGVDLIVTCDNGISAKDAINKAVDNGIAVVITDHHEVPEELPDADAIVDPKQEGDGYPFKEICGAFVAYKLVEILYENAEIPKDTLKELMMFAAIATVGDVMILKGENRTLVKKGLALMKETDSIGLNALIDACQIHKERLSAYTIGFVLGPCINAGGRLKTAQIAMELFNTGDADHARELAAHLKGLNDDRKEITNRFAEEAKQLVEKEYADDKVLVIYLKGCHESIAGIIAGRVREAFNRPTIVLTDSENEEAIEKGLVRGSARSIEKYDIHEKLTEVKELLCKFGGHKQAAGLTLKRENIDELRRSLNANSGLEPEDFIEKIWIDVALPFSYATIEQAEELELLEPFGQGNDRPIFAQKDVTVVSAKSLPGYNTFVKLKLKDSCGCACEGIIFADAEETLNGLAKKDKIDILYYPKPDYYGGRKSVQIQIKAWK